MLVFTINNDAGLQNAWNLCKKNTVPRIYCANIPFSEGKIYLGFAVNWQHSCPIYRLKNGSRAKINFSTMSSSK